MNRFILAAALAFLTGCTDPETARRALQNIGFTGIGIGGYAWFMCSEHDTFATRFTARNPQGQIVTGAVCSGWLKGATVRFD